MFWPTPRNLAQVIAQIRRGRHRRTILVRGPGRRVCPLVPAAGAADGVPAEPGRCPAAGPSPEAGRPDRGRTAPFDRARGCGPRRRSRRLSRHERPSHPARPAVDCGPFTGDCWRDPSPDPVRCRAVLVAVSLFAVPLGYARVREKHMRNFRVVEDGVLYRSGQPSPAGLGTRDSRLRNSHGRQLPRRGGRARRPNRPTSGKKSSVPSCGVNYVRLPLRVWSHDETRRGPGRRERAEVSGRHGGPEEPPGPGPLLPRGPPDRDVLRRSTGWSIRAGPTRTRWTS